MEKKKPIIGVTGPDKGGTAAWWFTKLALWLQNAKAIRIRPSQNEDFLQLDGLILGGGADINPERYGEQVREGSFQKQPKPSGVRQWIYRVVSFVFYPFVFIIRKVMSVKRVTGEKSRDDLEFRLLEDALAQGIPILGICRGSQLINVQFGGTLYQDINTFYTEIPRIHSVWPKKEVEIQKDSNLYSIFNTTKIWVNALHHQAINKVGDSLKEVAKEETGITQAIEHPGHSFLVGVQWHPEYMPQIPRQRNIFEELVRHSRQRISRPTLHLAPDMSG